MGLRGVSIRTACGLPEPCSAHSSHPTAPRAPARGPGADRATPYQNGYASRAKQPVKHKCYPALHKPTASRAAPRAE